MVASGMNQAQVDRELVRQHEIEVIEENFTRWVMAFGCIICLLLPVCLALFVYLVYSVVLEQNQDCDVPLRVWFYVVVANIIYHLNVGGRSIHRLVIRCFCCYEAPGHGFEPPPTRVRTYHMLMTVFVFVWHCVGLNYVRISTACSATAPNLYKASYLFAAFNVVFTIFTTISTFGLSHMLASLLRRGLLPTSMISADRKAPEGTMDLQETITYEPAVFRDSTQCPMCLEDFAAEQKIKKTLCHHIFHEECLASWFRVNRTCPLCRADLSQGAEGGEAGHGPESEPIGAVGDQEALDQSSRGVLSGVTTTRASVVLAVTTRRPHEVSECESEE